MFAHPRPALIVHSGAEAARLILAAAEREGATAIVVGLPRALAGHDTAQTDRVRALIGMLRTDSSLDVLAVDERLTSVEAARTVHGAERRRRGDLDSAAAAILLQAFLDGEGSRP